MPKLDIASLLIGLAAGLPASAVFFAGLAWTVRRILHARRPAVFLLLSFLGRAGLLLGLGVWATRQGNPLWVLAGFLLAFLLVRTLLIRKVRPAESVEPSEQHE